MILISAADDEDTTIKGIYASTLCSLSEYVESVEDSLTVSEAVTGERKVVAARLVSILPVSHRHCGICPVQLPLGKHVLVDNPCTVLKPHSKQK